MNAVVRGLWRDPVKSMGGEPCDELRVGARGITGDRAYALVDVASGHVASAKNPRLWGQLLQCAARYLDPPGANGHAAALEVTLPNGARVAADDDALPGLLSAFLGRSVRFEGRAPEAPTREEYWPDIEDLSHRDAITTEAMPSGTFFDCASVHLLTTGTLATLNRRYPGGRFDADRFRPNALIVCEDGAFPEDAWSGRDVRIGDSVVLHVSGPAPRCVMTTLAHRAIPADLGVLRTAAREHAANVGIYAEVKHGGSIREGDTVLVL